MHVVVDIYKKKNADARKVQHAVLISTKVHTFVTKRDNNFRKARFPPQEVVYR